MFNKAYQNAIRYFNHNGWEEVRDLAVITGDFFTRYSKQEAVRIVRADMINDELGVLRVVTTDGERYSPAEWLRNHSEEKYSFLKVVAEPSHVGYRLVLMK